MFLFQFRLFSIFGNFVIETENTGTSSSYREQYPADSITIHRTLMPSTHFRWLVSQRDGNGQSRHMRQPAYVQECGGLEQLVPHALVGAQKFDVPFGQCCFVAAGMVSMPVVFDPTQHALQRGPVDGRQRARLVFTRVLDKNLQHGFDGGGASDGLEVGLENATVGRFQFDGFHLQCKTMAQSGDSVCFLAENFQKFLRNPQEVIKYFHTSSLEWVAEG